ncbi:LAME_0F11672g1_1 [Lachancea meyersii CBS 8951]|uniref:Serine/threonine-protein kinase TEL1 n=1 Tax=Lachancea meyersii CBS 8951 TaxID=1266667 RepID=A0A1G4JW92_9SACH|nr:LAME_0F11672g1_1 [Lachancea meyersii CBS 8951]
MDSSHVPIIIDLLSSGKLKERNHGLDELTTILKQEPANLPSKYLYPILQVLVDLIELERTKYERLALDQSNSSESKITAIENRLSSAAYVLRLLVQTSNSKFKSKHVRFLVATLPSLMVDVVTGDLAASVSLHLLSSLESLIDSECFRLKFEPHQWVALVEKLSRLLSTHLEHSLSNKNIHCLMNVLSSLLLLDCTCLPEVESHLIEPLVKYLSNSKTENAAAKAALHLINTYIVQSHLINYSNCLELMETTIRFFVSIKKFSTTGLAYEFAAFNIFLSTLVNSPLYLKMHAGHLPTSFDTGRFLDIFEDYVAATLANFDPTKLDLKGFQFKKTSSRSEWLEFHDFQMRNGLDVEPCVDTLATAQLINCFFSIIVPLETEQGLLFKKTRRDESIESLLKDAIDAVDFIARCIESTQERLQLIGLQLCGFYATNSNLQPSECDRLAALVFQKFETPRLEGWVCFAFLPLVSDENSHLEPNLIQKVFVQCLSLIKSQDFCRLACALLKNLIHFHDRDLASENSIGQQVTHLFELADVNGPALVNDESFAFWKSLCGLEFCYKPVSQMPLSAKIESWLMSKWDQLDLEKPGQQNFHYFAAWLAGKEVTNFELHEQESLLSLKPSKYYSAWKNLSKERGYLLAAICGRRRSKALKVSTRTLPEPSELLQLWSKFTAFPRKSTRDNTFKIRWCCEAIKLSFDLVGDQRLADRLEDLSDQIVAIANNIDDPYAFFSQGILIEIYHLKTVSTRAHILLSNLGIPNILEELRKLIFEEATENDTENVDDFENSRELRSQSSTPKPNPRNFAECGVSIFENVLKLLPVEGSSLFGVSNQQKLSSVVKLLDGLPEKYIIISVPFISQFLKELDASEMDKQLLEQLTQVLASTLLSVKYNTSNEAISSLAMYLDSIRWVWITNKDDDLKADLKDIFQWIISKLHENLFCGISAVTNISKLLLNMLRFHDLSAGVIMGGKQKVFGDLIACVRRVPLFVIVKALQGFQHYLAQISFKNQSIVFAEIADIFKPSTNSIEVPAFHAMILSKVDAAATCQAVLSALEMMSFRNDQLTLFYGKRCFDTLALSNGLASKQDLFHLCRFDVIEYWYQKSLGNPSAAFDTWQIHAFEFESLDIFLKESVMELSAIYFSHKTKLDFFIKRLGEVNGQKETGLLENCLQLALPLCHAIAKRPDELGRYLRDHLGKRYTKLVGDLSHEIAYWVLHFTQLDILDDLRSAFDLLFPDSMLPKVLLADSSMKLKGHSRVHIVASASLSLLKTHLNAHHWDHRDLSTLLSRLTVDLEATAAAHLKINVLRQMKCLLVLAESSLKNCTFLPRLVRVLAHNFNLKELRTELQGLINCIVCLGLSQSADVVEMYSAVFSCLLSDQAASDSALIESLEHHIKVTDSGAIKEYANTWKTCLNILRGGILDATVYLDDALLRIDSPSQERFLLLSQIFNFHAEPKPLPIDFNYSVQVTNNLLALSEVQTETTSNFDQWRGYYVGGYYLKNASLPKQLRPVSIFSRQDPTPLDNLLMNVYNYRDRVTEPRSYFSISCVLSLVSDTFGRRRDLYLGENGCFDAVNQERFPLSDCEFRLLPELKYAFVVARYSLDHVVSMSNLSYTKWVSKLTNVLSHELESFLPGFCGFVALTEEKPEFVEALFLDMFLVLERTDSKIGSTLLSIFLKSSCAWKSEADVTDFKPKSLLALRLFSMVRSEAVKGNVSLKKLYQGLELKEFYRLASAVKMVTLAYMIFEEYEDIIDSSNVLGIQTVFKALGDSDLIQALPIEPSLNYAFSSVSEHNARSIKNFMFNNCQFDVDRAMGNSPTEHELIKSSSLNGFNGLADLLGNANTNLFATDNQEAYQWSLRLNNWDLPTPEHYSSDSDAIYALSKKIYNAPYNIVGTARSHLREIVAHSAQFHSKKEWAGSLATTLCAELYNEHATDLPRLKSLLDQTKLFDKKCIENGSFFEHQTQMKGRQAMLGLSSSNYSAVSEVAGLKVCELLEIENYASRSRENFDLQESLTAAILLGKKADCLNCLTKTQKWSNLAILQGAQALWLQEDHQIAISMLERLFRDSQNYNPGTLDVLGACAQISQVQVKALLVEWTSLLRKENAQTIYAKYISETANEIATVGEYSDRAEIFLKFGEFCFQQLKRLESDKTVSERQRRSKRGNMELSGLLEIVRDSNSNERDRKEAKKHFNRLKLQIEQDQDILLNQTKQQKLFAWKSAHFYLSALVYGSHMDDDVLDKFCGLWFQHAEDGELNSKLYHEISSIPSFKFLPWINQLTSRLSIDSTPFQRNLQLTLKRVMFKLPNETLYPLVSLKLYRRVQPVNDPIILLKVKAVEKLFKELERYDNGQFLREYLYPIEEFCERSVDLSCLKIPKGSRTIDLTSLKAGKYWLEDIKLKALSLPTNPFPITCSADGRKLRSTITHLDPNVFISSSGLSLPKIATFYLSDGSRRKVLMKGSNDDLRQDSIMEQVFKQVNQILLKNKQTRERNLRIRTYEVVPLGPQAGLIEFVPDSVSLHEVLNKLHKNDELSFDKARKIMKQSQSKPLDERIEAYSSICDYIKPRLRQFFFQSFDDSQAWLDAKYAYTKAVVTTSIVGYILGLGDRHLNNILLDKSNGEPVHIDLGVAFDQGKLLPIPELVPFRLTRDIVDGFGVTGVEGIFRNNCERVFSVLHRERDRVMNVLNVLKWDPLYSWVVSPLRKRKLQAHISDDSEEIEVNANGTSSKEDNNESMRALKDVQSKLEGNGLSVEATVQDLIQQATDVGNLSTIYMGWSPFY